MSLIEVKRAGKPLDIIYTLTPTLDSVQHVPASASADSDDGVNVAANVLDSSTATWWQSADTIMPHWVKLDLGDGTPQIVNQFRLTNMGGLEGYAPKDFTIEGSNDDSNWTVLKTVTGASYDPDNTGTLAEAYNFVNTTAYRYYKINVTKNYEESANNVAISEISLWFSYLGADWGNPYILGTNNEDILYVDTINIGAPAFVLVDSTTPKKIVNVGCISGGSSNIIAFAWADGQGAQTNGNSLPSFNSQQGLFIGGGKNTDVVPNNPSGWDFVNKFSYITPGPLDFEGGFEKYPSGLQSEEGFQKRWTLSGAQYDALTDGNNDGSTGATKVAIFLSPYDSNNVYVGGKFGFGGNDNPQESVDATGNIKTDSQFISTLADGTKPIDVTSTTVCTNLNADLLDGKHVGTSGNVVPLLDGANTWSGIQTHSEDIKVASDTKKQFFGAGDDMSIDYDGTQGNIKTDLVAASDLHIDCGTDKTIVLDETVYQDMQFPISSGKVPAANFPNYEAFTTNTNAYAFGVDEYIDLACDEVPHAWKIGTDGSFHLHFALKTDQSTGADRFAKFSAYVAYADVNEVWTETTITAEATIPTGTVALKHLFLTLGTLTLTNNLIGTQIKVRIKRIAATGGTEYADDIFITQVGCHLECDTVGSRSVSAK